MTRAIRFNTGKSWETSRNLTGRPPRRRVQALRTLLPDRKLPVRYAHRIAGLGSLGKHRYVALGEWDGGPIARECKPITPSAAAWAKDKRRAKSCYSKILRTAVRSADPLFAVHGNWIVRRLAPDCSRIELANLSRVRDDEHLLHAMGWETANIHLGTKGARALIATDLKRRRKPWLHPAAAAMVEATLEDWERWRTKSATKLSKYRLPNDNQ